MTPYLEDSDLTIYQGDALAVLRELPAESVHCIATSPPFYALRDYGTGRWEGGDDEECDHIAPQGGPSVKQESNVGTRQIQFRATCRKCGATRIDQQIGLEPTPEEWAQKLVEVFREARRVLRKDGTPLAGGGDS